MDSANIIDWKQMPDIPENRYGGHMLGYSMVANEDGLYLYFGALNGEDMLCFDMKNQAWYKISCAGPLDPSLTNGHTAVIYKTSMIVFRFGGKICNALSINHSIWEYQFSTKQWKKVNTQGQVPDRDHGAAVYGDQLWIFSVHRTAKRMWTISLLDGTKEWKLVEHFGNCPRIIYHHTVAVVGDYMYILGQVGRHRPPIVDIKLFRFSFKERTWLCLKNMPRLATTGKLTELAMVAY